MKLSVSLPQEDVSFIDRYSRAAGAASRSAVIQRAIHLLRVADLGSAYAEAWQEWESAEDASLWDAAVGDGIKSTSQKRRSRASR